jgi:hypothetical protein
MSHSSCGPLYFASIMPDPGLLARTPVTILFPDNYSDFPRAPDEDLGREFGFSMKI